MCPQVVVLNKCNIAQLHFDINKEIPLKQSSRSNFCHSFMKVLLFLEFLFGPANRRTEGR